MAIRYRSLELQQPELFGIGLGGTVGRTDKGNLLELADKCMSNGKLCVVMDLSDLSAIGGGGAKILAEFQERLVAADGEAVFVGAGQVVRRFLQQKFDALPLRFFPTLLDAESRFNDPEYHFDPDEAEAEIAADTAAVAEAETEADEDCQPTEGAAVEVEEEGDGDPSVSEASTPAASADAEAGEAMSDVLEEFNGSDEDVQVQVGRRKDHHYTSLAEAMEDIVGWSPFTGQTEFVASLRNLLFSHGLADNVVVLTGHEDLLVDEDQRWEIPLEGTFAKQVAEAELPLSMLDVQEHDLVVSETNLLEELTPDLILPVRRGDRLDAIIMLMRGEGDNEYSVAEHFALELLMRVLGDSSRDKVASRTVESRTQPAPDRTETVSGKSASAIQPAKWQAAALAGDAMANVLMSLALNLPEASDKPHFWRMFARHSWPALPLRSLGFLAPGMHRAQIIAGDSDSWKGVNLGEEKLRHFLRTMQRPVRVANLPAFFQETKDALMKAGADWIVGLIWEDEFLGTAFAGIDSEFACEDPVPLLSELFDETARLLHRFDSSADGADASLQIARLFAGQREKRCYGTDELTEAIVMNLHRLGRAMGFAADQERDLVYGGLLRDIGLIDKDDALSGPTEDLDPIQWPVYRKHPTHGVALLTGMNVSQTVVDVVQSHHERFDGKGFPRGLEGRKIPLAARVEAVVECYVSMIAGGGGTQPVEAADAAQALRDDHGRRFDPDIVEVFLKSLQRTDDDSAPAEEPVPAATGSRS